MGADAGEDDGVASSLTGLASVLVVAAFGGNAFGTVLGTVRSRVGIIAVRSPQLRGAAASGRSPVGAHRLGNSSALPGVVTRVRPEGIVQITVPSGNCRSCHPQNVLSM